MLRTGVIIQKKAGQTVPQDYLEVALKQCPDAAGFIIQAEEEGEPVLITERAKTATLASIMDVQETYKDNAMLLYLGGNGEFSEESFQPFVLSSSEHGDIFAYMCEGDFPKYSDPKSPHSDEYHLDKDLIDPLLRKALKVGMASDNENKYEAFIEELDKTFEQNLMNSASSRCVFAFMPLKGDAIAFGENTDGEVYEWGTVSHKFGYDPSGQKEQEVKPAKRRFFFSKAKEDIEAREAAESKAAVTTVASKPADHIVGDTPKTDTAIPAAALKGHYEQMPDTIVRGGHQAMKQWIRKIYGMSAKADLPKNWKNTRKFFIPDTPIKSFTELETLVKDGKIELVESSAKPVEAKDMKKDAPTKVESKAAPAEEVRKNVTATAKAVKQEEANVMTLAVEEQTSANAQLATFLDYKSQPAPNPLGIQKMEAKYAAFSQVFPVEFEELLLLTPTEWSGFQKSNPKAFFLYFLEMKRKYIEVSGIKLEYLVPTNKKEEATTVNATASSPAVVKKGRASLFSKTA